MNRRNLVGTTALVGIASLGLAACTSASNNATAQSVFAEIQYILPLVKVLAAGIAIAVPQAASLVATVTPYLTQAGAVFQGLSATMTAVAAQPIVQQVEAYLASAVDAVANTVNGGGVGSTLAKFGPQVAEAQAVLALIVAFANGVQGGPVAASAVRAVSLPLLHK